MNKDLRLIVKILLCSILVILMFTFAKITLILIVLFLFYIVYINRYNTVLLKKNLRNIINPK